jgi:hypothetical protein
LLSDNNFCPALRKQSTGSAEETGATFGTGKTTKKTAVAAEIPLNTAGTLELIINKETKMATLVAVRGIGTSSIIKSIRNARL